MFKNKLNVEVDEQGEIRTLTAPLRYVNKKLDLDITVPKGFKTNYGSVPMFLQSIISASGKATYGYVIHDYLYSIGKYTKKESDAILSTIMTELGVSKWRVVSVYYGLKIGGSKAWNNCRKLDKKNIKIKRKFKK